MKPGGGRVRFSWEIDAQIRSGSGPGGSSSLHADSNQSKREEECGVWFRVGGADGQVVKDGVTSPMPLPHQRDLRKVANLINTV